MCRLALLAARWEGASEKVRLRVQDHAAKETSKSVHEQMSGKTFCEELSLLLLEDERHLRSPPHGAQPVWALSFHLKIDWSLKKEKIGPA